MDLLQKELQRKKEALAKAREKAAVETSDDGGGKRSGKKRKYLKAGEVRQMEEEEEEERQQCKRRQLQPQEKLHQDHQRQSQSSGTNGTLVRGVDDDGGLTDSKATTQDHGTLAHKTGNTGRDDQGTTSAAVVEDTTPTAVTQQLRQLGLVIRFFGETQKERVGRLRVAQAEQSIRLKGLSELDEFRLGQGHSIRNEFLQRDEAKPKAARAAASTSITTVGHDSLAEGSNNNSTDIGKGNKPKANEDDHDDDDQSDPPKFIYKYLKELLKEWEKDLADRPDSVARSVTGRNESKTFKQCKDYIRPLFKLLKSRQLEDGLQQHLLKIVNFSKEGEFVKAHDEYMNVAIGRAAWPIGVTMVGIHARSGRAKIESSKVAHVMNSELQRKYLTSVKRLMTYAQKKRPDVDPSKKVQN